MKYFKLGNCIMKLCGSRPSEIPGRDVGDAARALRAARAGAVGARAPGAAAVCAGARAPPRRAAAPRPPAQPARRERHAPCVPAAHLAGTPFITRYYYTIVIVNKVNYHNLYLYIK